VGLGGGRRSPPQYGSRGYAPRNFLNLNVEISAFCAFHRGEMVICHAANLSDTVVEISTILRYMTISTVQHSRGQLPLPTSPLSACGRLW